MKHSQCLISQVKLAPEYRAKCVHGMQANSETVHSLFKETLNTANFIRGICCSYNDWENCILGFLREKCGEEAANRSIPPLIHHSSMYLLYELCHVDTFDATDQKKCPPELFKAPLDMVPLGYRSKSLLSHYFTSFCPNVGYMWSIKFHLVMLRNSVFIFRYIFWNFLKF